MNVNMIFERYEDVEDEIHCWPINSKTPIPSVGDFISLDDDTSYCLDKKKALGFLFKVIGREYFLSRGIGYEDDYDVYLKVVTADKSPTYPFGQ